MSHSSNNPTPDNTPHHSPGYRDGTPSRLLQVATTEDVEISFLNSAHPTTPPPNNAAPKRRRFHSCDNGFLTDWWFWELLAAIFSVLCLAAMIGLLIWFDNKKLPHSPDAITLNALISVLAAATKASLMVAVAAAIGQLQWKWFRNDKTTLADLQVFDEATRGPWGAFRFLPLVGWKSVASVGAIVTILSISIDPFAQQIITFSSRIVYEPDLSATTKQVFTYASNSANISTTEEFDTLTKAQTLDMERAIFQGIYARDSVLRPACPSENCDFPPVDSLAWCSACEDVTSQTTFGKCMVDIDLSKINSTVRHKIPCNITLPNDVDFNVTINVEPYSDDNFMSAYDVYVPTVRFRSVFDYDDNDFLIWTPGMSYAGIINPVAAFAYIKFTGTSDFSSQAPTVMMESATICALSPCINKYQSSVRGGAPNTIILETVWGDFVIDMESEQGNWTATIPASKSTNGQDLYFHLNSSAAMAPKVMVDTILNFEIRNRWYMNTTINNATGEYRIQTSLETLDYLSSGITLRSVYNGLGIEKTFENLASTLSVLIYDASNDTITGELGTAETFVRVRWVWILAPLSVVVLGVSFFLITVYDTQRSKARIWKTSSLAPIWRAKQENWNSGIANSGAHFGFGDWKLSKMESEAKKITAGMLKAVKRKPVGHRRDVSGDSTLLGSDSGNWIAMTIPSPLLDVPRDGSPRRSP